MIANPAAGRVVAARLHARALSMQKEWAWKTAIRQRAGFASRPPEGAARPRARFDTSLLVLGVVALVALLVLGLVVVLLSWSVAALPYAVRVACPEAHVCGRPDSDEGPALGIDDDPRANASGLTQ
jgi:hypothetical protein